MLSVTDTDELARYRHRVIASSRRPIKAKVRINMGIDAWLSIATVVAGSALDILQAGQPPRSVFVDYPLGHSVG